MLKVGHLPMTYSQLLHALTDKVHIRLRVTRGLTDEQAVIRARQKCLESIDIVSVKYVYIFSSSNNDAVAPSINAWWRRNEGRFA